MHPSLSDWWRTVPQCKEAKYGGPVPFVDEHQCPRSVYAIQHGAHPLYRLTDSKTLELKAHNTGSITIPRASVSPLKTRARISNSRSPTETFSLGGARVVHRRH
jgi:hypothetical protein